jgi:hypothetical protein
VRITSTRVAVAAASLLLGVTAVLGLRVWSQWWPRDGGPPWDHEPDSFGTQLWAEALGRTQAIVTGTVTDDGGPDLPFSRWTTITVTPERVTWQAAEGDVPAWERPVTVAATVPVEVEVARAWQFGEGDTVLIGLATDDAGRGPVASVVVPLDPDVRADAGPDDERAAWARARQFRPGATDEAVAQALAESARSEDHTPISEILSALFPENNPTHEPPQ